MAEKRPHGSLGTLRLRHEHTNEILLIPQPSNDPNDPLNWPQWYKYFIAGLSAWAILLSTFGAAGPAVVLSQMAITFFGPPGPDFLSAIAKSAYFVSVCALMMGISNVVWVPLMIKYGRRPVYIFAYVLYCGTSIWCAKADSFASMLVARVLLGCAAGAGEVLGPLTISDIFFVHERGTMMAIYSCTLSAGTSVGAVISGLITINKPWQDIFWVSAGLTGGTALFMFFTLPETTYVRQAQPSTTLPQVTAGTAPADSDHINLEKAGFEEHDTIEAANLPPQRVLGDRPTMMQIIKSMPRSFTSESMWKLSLRPIVLIVLPSALWASLVMAVSIGFLVAVSSNISTAFSATYGFETWQIGVSMISGAIGAVIGIWFGGSLSDSVADYLTRRNNGVREPEMRLPAMVISLITGPLSLILYGVGVGHQLHWICPVIGLGLLNFTIVQAANISVVYMIDCYRPVAGEVTMTQYTFKSLFGFLLSFYTNDWIAQSGYINAFGEMASISAAVFLCSFIFYFYGKKMRNSSWHWPVMRKFVHWKGDREVGE
ncbi:hypothetical protein SBRCBS47491_001810 [Sporothrix bragantina]|uniref:Major facilitator superfamily (MFS) profile domain-containing protein n=1 Tax=Sporothrix bragantina TaxID=671064 RepID=A0ABP0B264_9PEZI